MGPSVAKRAFVSKKSREKSLCHRGDIGTTSPLRQSVRYQPQAKMKKPAEAGWESAYHYEDGSQTLPEERPWCGGMFVRPHYRLRDE